MCVSRNYKVSVLVPVYGVEKYIERCARSLFEQTYQNIEFIFVDDCSKDDSIKILKEVMNFYPQRKECVRIIHHPYNKGLAGARNTAVLNASGDFFLWVDSDDFVDITLVEKCIGKYTDSNCDIVLFDYYRLCGKNNSISRQVHCKTVRERTLKLLARHVSVCVWCGLYKSSLYLANHIEAVEGINNNEDYQVTPKLSYYSKSIAYLDEALYYYNCDNLSSITKCFSASNAEQGWKSIEILYDFFKNEGEDYLNAIEIAKINRYASYIRLSVHNGNKEYFNKMKSEIQLFKFNKWRNVSCYLLPCLFVKNYLILRAYLLSFEFLKSQLLKILNYIK